MAGSGMDADVAIIGYGPSGVAAANFLGGLGVSTIAFERTREIYPRARAVTINDWTMRCFQSAGLDEALKAVMDETFGLRWITYDGRVLNRLGFGASMHGHAQSYSIYQPAMEEVLRAGARRHACNTVCFGSEVVALQQDADGVRLTALDVESRTPRRVRTRYALACDGGSSATRERLGVRLLGDTTDTRWVVIDARVKRWWPDRHILTFWSDPVRPVVDIALALGHHRWELPLEPHESEADFDSHASLWRLLGTFGVTPDDVEIQQHAFYRHHVRQAERWRVGRVLLVGDAAHLMPPWAGQGMQSGVRDAHNLAWKLQRVLGGTLPDALLDTYQAERAPDVRRYTDISVGLGRLIRQELSDAELAALRPEPGKPPPPSPLMQPPCLTDGWIAGTGAAVGRIFPQCRVACPDGSLRALDGVLGNGFAVLADAADPRALLPSAHSAPWQALGANFHTLRPPSAASESAADIIDISGDLLGWMRGHGASIVALRPDRFVAAAGTRLEMP